MIDFEDAPSGGGGRARGIFQGHRYQFVEEVEWQVAPPTEARAEITLNTPEDELPGYLQNLNLPQKEAALETHGPVMVLAGAGSGKTRMLTARIAYLIDCLKISPYRILAVTFTNKAAMEMRQRIGKALQHSVAYPDVGTFHSIAVKILRRESQHLPFTQPFVIYDDSDQLSLIRSVLNKLGLDTKKTSPKAVQAFVNRMKCDGVEPHEFQPADFDRSEKQMKEIYGVYQKALVDSNALDFGEILCITYRLFRDQEAVRKRYQSLYQFIHVDEYQDTNRIQYLLLSMLTSRKWGGHENLCVVGDEDQSIYKWRGADIGNILDFENEYPGAKVIKLEQNYRSSQTIIRAASDVIAHNTERKRKTLWTENPEGDPIQRIHVVDERMEAQWVIAEIQRLGREQGYSLNDMAILYRTHAQSRQFEDYLRREKLPYQMIGGVRFYDRKEIKDILAYLKVLINPSDSVSLARIINVPARGIGKTTLEKLEELTHSKEPDAPTTLWGALKTSLDQNTWNARVHNKLSDFLTKIERMRSRMTTELVSDVYHELLEATGYVSELKKEGTVEAESRIENLEELDNLIKEFEDELLRGKTEDECLTLKPQLLGIFLERTSLVSSTDDAMEGSTLKMMTLHGCKGLEFPIVFMVGLEEGLFPSTRPWEEVDEEEMEEERRLCYVGMTRAEQRLYMTHANSRRVWGQFQIHEPSRFLSEIPKELVHQIRLIPQQARSPMAPSSGFSLSGSSGKHPWIGQEIRHPQYGIGSIHQVTGSEGDERVVVRFKSGLEKKFLARFLMGE